MTRFQQDKVMADLGRLIDSCAGAEVLLVASVEKVVESAAGLLFLAKGFFARGKRVLRGMRLSVWILITIFAGLAAEQGLEICPGTIALIGVACFERVEAWCVEIAEIGVFFLQRWFGAILETCGGLLRVVVSA